MHSLLYKRSMFSEYSSARNFKGIVQKCYTKYTNPARGILDFCKQKFWPLPCSQLTKEKEEEKEKEKKEKGTNLKRRPPLPGGA